MFENLRERIEKAVKNLKGKGRITEINIASTVKEIRNALITADVHYKIAKEVTNSIKKKALGRDILTNVSPGQLFTKIVSEELALMMGEKQVSINIHAKPCIILLAGLQGAGKTTLAAKLGLYFKEKSKKVLLASCDVYRPAAIDQLYTLAQDIDITVFQTTEKKPLKIAKDAVAYAKENGFHMMILDTAGRLAVDQKMMQEIQEIKKKIQPTETLLALDAMTGQDAVNIAKSFDEYLQFDGVILTKMDGDARGGAALTLRYVVDKPIKMISHGEKVQDLDIFHPDRMAKRILGMDDIVSLVEKSQAVYDEKEAKKILKKVYKNTLDFNDFYSQIQKIKKLGGAQKLMNFVPGIKKNLQTNEDINFTLQPFEVIIQSMTPKERENPSLLDAVRKRRIANGSGQSLQMINQLITYKDRMKKIIKNKKMLQQELTKI